MKWSNGNKKIYTNKGYIFTKNGDVFNVDIKDLSKNSKVKVDVICDYCNKPYQTKYGQYLIGRKVIEKDCCRKCTGKKTSEVSYKRRSIDVFSRLSNICLDKGYKLLTKISEYTTILMDVSFICPKHGIRTMSIDSLLSGHECILCSYEKRGINKKINSKELIQIIESKNNNKILNPDAYINYTTNNLEIQCNCGRIFYTSLGNYRTQDRCSFCSEKESSGEKIIREYLDRNNINYIQEKRFDDCRDIKPLPFDFYLIDYNLIIEFDGEHHFKIVFDDKQFETTKKHDQIKNDYCKNNNIELLRIPYWNGSKIETIIQNKLDEIDKRNSLI